MKLLVVLALVALATAAPSPKEVHLLRYDSDVDGIGNYKYGFEQTDGTKHQEQGDLVNPGTDDESISVKGSYSWVGPDGVTYIVNYVADDNGFQPTIDQGPGGAVPPAVIASLLG